MALPVVLLVVVGAFAAACGSDDTGGEDDGSGEEGSASDGGEASGEESESGGAGAEAEAPAAGPDCDPARPGEDVEDVETFDFEGEPREYLLALPEDYDGTTAAPLVFDIHGFGNNKEAQSAGTRLAEVGAERGYVVVTPEALGDPREWNMFGDEARVDDFGYIHALVDDLSERLCIDADRVYAAGHSNGSAFTGFMACREPYGFAAVAMVSAFVPSTCEAEGGHSVVAFHGTADPGVPYEGGAVAGGPVQIPGALATLDQYAEAYGCDRPMEQDEPAPEVELRSFTGCVDGTELALYTIVGGGHEWPGDVTRPGADEPDQFSATEAMLDFFDAHPA